MLPRIYIRPCSMREGVLRMLWYARVRVIGSFRNILSACQLPYVTTIAAGIIGAILSRTQRDNELLRAIRLVFIQNPR